MKKITFLLSACAAVTYIFSSCSTTSSKPIANAASDNIQMVKCGEYLVNTIGCDDCHSPKKMRANGPEVDAALRFSDYPAERPLPPANEDALKSG